MPRQNVSDQGFSDDEAAFFAAGDELAEIAAPDADCAAETPRRGSRMTTWLRKRRTSR